MNTEYNIKNPLVAGESNFKYQPRAMKVLFVFFAAFFTFWLIGTTLAILNGEELGASLFILIILFGFLTLISITAVEVTPEGLRIQRAYIRKHIIKWHHISKVHISSGQYMGLFIVCDGCYFGRVEIPISFFDNEEAELAQLMQNIAAAAGLRKSPDAYILPSYER